MIRGRRRYEDRLAPEIGAPDGGPVAGDAPPVALAGPEEEVQPEAPDLAARAAGRVTRLLRRADLRVVPGDVLLATGACGAVGGVAMWLSGADGIFGWPAIAVGALGGLLAPIALIAWLAKRRSRKIDERLADALDLVVSGLQAGFTAQAAMEHVAGELRGPLARELAELGARMRLGETPSVALRAFADASGGENARLFARALAIKWDVGGGLAETLAKISATARERTRLARLVRSLTAQGKLTALVLFLMPYFVALGSWLIDPDKLAGLWRSSVGVTLLEIGFFLQAIGLVWIARLVRSEV